MTDRDYSDMVDPYVRAELEAFRRGYREGFLGGLWWVLVAVVVGLVIYAGKLNAAEWWMSETWAPIKASQCGGRVTVCSNNDAGGRWTCFCVK